MGGIGPAPCSHAWSCPPWPARMRACVLSLDASTHEEVSTRMRGSARVLNLDAEGLIPCPPREQTKQRREEGSTHTQKEAAHSRP